MRKAGAAAFVAAAVLAASTPGAPAAPLLRDAGNSYGPPISDGKRYVVWKATPTSVSIADRRDGVTRDVAVAPGCNVSNAGAGLALLACRTAPARSDLPTPMLLHLAKGVVFRPAGADTLKRYTESSMYLAGVGRHWIAAYTSGYHWSAVRYLDWRTGEVRDQPAGANVATDLDAAGLTTPLCAPLRRERNPDASDPYEVSDAWYDVLYERPWALERRQSFAAPVSLRRCGGSRRLVSSCEETCSVARLAGGRVFWLEKGRARRFEIRTGRRAAWRLPVPFPVDLNRSPAMAPTSDTMVLAVPGRAYDDPWRLFSSAPLRR